jgi:hypothetical protein
MKSLFCSRISKFNILITLGALGLTTLTIPATAAPKEACVKTSAGNIVCGTPVEKPNSTSNQADSDETLQTAVDQNVYYPSTSPTWELKSCTRTKIQETVRCTFIISNNADTTYVIRQYITKMVDASGNEYPASLIKVGNLPASDSVVQFNMTKGARYKTTIDFPKVPTSIPQVILLQSGNVGTSGVKFRDVPIN